MQQSILFKVSGKPSSSPLVILTGPTISGRYSTPITARLSRALSSAWQWTRCNCTSRHIVTSSCVICAILAIFAGMDTAFSGSDGSRILLAVATLLGLPLSIIGAFISSGKGGAE
ncbi:hypothetical protein [uncultured Duncaniella sp.]|uniref:hypothetical protein n=1 Tax=uncultured Duncaniella sp. TaxID=2768039 RepID=UPI0025A9ABEE|nr:hypothetical protein [uncultured Duncaniella sp.]